MAHSSADYGSASPHHMITRTDDSWISQSVTRFGPDDATAQRLRDHPSPTTPPFGAAVLRPRVQTVTPGPSSTSPASNDDDCTPSRPCLSPPAQWPPHHRRGVLGPRLHPVLRLRSGTTYALTFALSRRCLSSTGWKIFRPATWPQPPATKASRAQPSLLREPTACSPTTTPTTTGSSSSSRCQQHSFA